MKRLILILITFLFSYGGVLGQDKINTEVVRMIDSIKGSLCAQDTLMAMKQLERLEHAYPTDGMIRLSNKILGDLYISQGNTKPALEKLLYALQYEPTSYPFFQNNTDCDQIFNSFSFSRSKADICVSISRAYLIEKKLDSSLVYLQLADDIYLPYKGCGNGFILYKSYLSPYFADQYLAMGDTSRAIGRLLDFFMLPDGNMKQVTDKLKQILSMRLHPPEIRKEVDQGLANLKIVKGGRGEPKSVLVFTLFGHVIKQDAGEQTLAYWQHELATETSIKQLTE